MTLNWSKVDARPATFVVLAGLRRTLVAHDAAAITRVCYWSPALTLDLIGVGFVATAAHVNRVFESARRSSGVDKEILSERQLDLKGKSILTIAEIWNSCDEQVWLQALERYVNYLKPSDIELVKELEPLDVASVQRMNAQEWYDFLYHKYFRWKYTAPNRLATTRKSLQQYQETNSLDDLFKIKERLFAFDKENIREGLTIASAIKGLGIAGASGLLTLLFPDKFGTVDQFVVKALREIGGFSETDGLEKMNPEGLTVPDGVSLIKIMRSKADKNNQIFDTKEWTPKKIDMILWTYGRKET